MTNAHAQYMVSAHTQFRDERSQAPRERKLSIAEMANAHAKFMDDVEQRVNKSLLRG